MSLYCTAIDVQPFYFFEICHFRRISEIFIAIWTILMNTVIAHSHIQSITTNFEWDGANLFSDTANVSFEWQDSCFSIILPIFSLKSALWYSYLVWSVLFVRWRFVCLAMILPIHFNHFVHLYIISCHEHKSHLKWSAIPILLSQCLQIILTFTRRI